MPPEPIAVFPDVPGYREVFVGKVVVVAPLYVPLAIVVVAIEAFAFAVAVGDPPPPPATTSGVLSKVATNVPPPPGS